MDQYVTGAMVRRLREERGLTQQQLAERLNVSDKAVSRWETGRGYPDITLIQPLASALGVSVIELFAGEGVVNRNRAANMLRLAFYVCPICGNVIWSTGEAVVSCCGLTLPRLEAETADGEHGLSLEPVEDEFYVTARHEMSKTHCLSFIAAVGDDGCDVRKLYPEWDALARFRRGGTRYFYYYCNRHGLFKASVSALLQAGRREKT